MAAAGVTGGQEHALATRALTKRYGRHPALQGLDLAVPRGVVYGFLGPNGAGKTTTMRLLVGLIRPDSGSMEVLGRPYHSRDRRPLHDVGALIETPTFYPYLSGRDNLRVFAAAGAAATSGRVEQVLEFVGLRQRGRDKFKTYSLGMKQRLGIALALLNDPQLLLLDEPANGLDPAGIVAMRETLRYLTSRGKTVFLSSHILPEVEQLADVVGIINHGRLVREGRLADLLEELGNVQVRVPAEDLGRAGEILQGLAGRAVDTMTTGPYAGWLRARVPPSRAGEVNRALAEAGIYASALTAGSDLETVFLTATQSPGPTRP